MRHRRAVRTTHQAVPNWDAVVRARVARGVLCVLAVAGLSRVAAAFDLNELAEKAQQLAKESYHEPKQQVPDWLLKMTYDQWRDIRFRPEKALWHDQHLPFQVQFFHPGLYYNRIVTINVVDAKGIQALEYSPSQFDYGKSDFASRVPQDLGYAGFRVPHTYADQDTELL